MWKLIRSITVIVLVWAIASCSGSIAVPNTQNSLAQTRSMSVELDRQFTLRQGEIAEIVSSAELFTVEWIDIRDSRCPSGNQCVWEGQVAVSVKVMQGDRELGTVELVKSSQNRDAAKTTIGGYEIEAIEVKPYPKTARRIPLSDYRVTLVMRLKN
jgi:hypothetical protein